MDTDRRRFLTATGAAFLSALASSCRRAATPNPAPGADPLPRLGLDEGLIVYPAPPGSRCTETLPEILGKSWITPNSHFFELSRKIVKHSDEQRDRWQIRIAGEVEHPFQVTVHDLLTSKDVRLIKFAGYLQCVGNGRRSFSPPAGNPPFGMGAIGNAFWAGTPVADLLLRACVKPRARYVSFVEQGASLDRPKSYIKSIPLKKAMDLQTILVLQMNGEPLPDEHGGPVRALVPGWGGTYSVKWLSDVLVTEEPWKGYQMEVAYRVPSRPIAPGSSISPAAMQPFTAFAVGSMFTAPSDGARLQRGRVLVGGLAWTGEASVTRVEVSVDNGRTWRAAHLEPETRQIVTSSDHGATWTPLRSGIDESRYVWHRWRFEWDAVPGEYRLRVRAYDSDGKVQPLEQDNWNPGGYGWHAADFRRVTIA
jgi:DMSO/TMAO reductase YedYZ molybdopterin-dependent catalytic subunit